MFITTFGDDRDKNSAEHYGSSCVSRKLKAHWPNSPLMVFNIFVGFFVLLCRLWFTYLNGNHLGFLEKARQGKMEKVI